MTFLEIVFLGIVVAAIIAEAIWSTVQNRKAYNLKESLANLFIVTGNNALKPLTLAWMYALFSLLEPWQVVTWPINAASVIAALLAAELAYYWYHRLSHEIPMLWSVHHTHHSSPWMNFTTALRMNWLGSIIMPVFFAPLILLGFSSEVIAGYFVVAMIYQFFLHSETVGRLGIIEGKFFNTPSSHRVHHGTNHRYLDRNYGAVLIVYDRLFGTYEPEKEKVDYGVTTGFMGHNPIKILFLPMLQYFRGGWKRDGKMIEEP